MLETRQLTQRAYYHTCWIATPYWSLLAFDVSVIVQHRPHRLPTWPRTEVNQKRYGFFGTTHIMGWPSNQFLANSLSGLVSHRMNGFKLQQSAQVRANAHLRLLFLAWRNCRFYSSRRQPGQRLSQPDLVKTRFNVDTVIDKPTYFIQHDW